MKNKMVTRISASVKSALLVVAGSALLLGCDGMLGKSEEAVAGAANTQAVQQSATPTTAERNELVIGLYDDYAPLTFRNADGDLRGFDIDLARLVMEKMGVPYEFKAIDWSAKEGLLNDSKRIDMLWSGVHISEERKKIFAFSDVYLENPTVVVVRPDSEMQSVDDVGGKVVGVQEGFFAIPDIKSYSGPNGRIRRIVEEPENSLVLVDLMLGKVDAVIIDSTQVEYYAKSTPGKFRVLPGHFVNSGIAIALRKGDSELLTKINLALEQAKNDGSYQQVYQKWFGAN